MDAAIAEFDRLVLTYADLGYGPIILPKRTVEQRADFVLGPLV
ncbi:hypothetical protein NX02_10030 [Sphingomonas sanxanigenens DSM 19645 = NX02]|uniref:Uncharacterized protein n=1 Tax=Sphingomonas sanxanigenens DSM 19645 = NX02 TaxID=1123269 RepID=W0A9F6_9SPHN|nr:hypothetical protein NX02_10030 [Sphingomonas sanxanigenens DSM 19645 = NX02]